MGRLVHDNYRARPGACFNGLDRFHSISDCYCWEGADETKAIDEIFFLAAFRTGIFRAEAVLAEVTPFVARMRASTRLQVTAVRVFVADFAEQIKEEVSDTAQNSHISSARNWDGTNGASETCVSLVPRRMPYQTRKESAKIIATSSNKAPHTAASRRALKIKAWVAAV